MLDTSETELDITIAIFYIVTRFFLFHLINSMILSSKSLAVSSEFQMRNKLVIN